MEIRNIPKNKLIRFVIAACIYTAFVIWVDNYWLLLGLIVIFDIYITKKIKWAFWKQDISKGQKRSRILEWVDAGIFALVVATIVRTFLIEAYVIPTPSMEKSLLVGDYLFVSKVSYGPRLPNTPISFPLVHNHLSLGPINTESYSKIIQMPYKRIAGLGKIKRNDVVVFNFPLGDTIIKDHPEITDYYRAKRSNTEFESWLKANNYQKVARPVDKTDNYVKRCVALPGDVFEVKQGEVHIGGQKEDVFPGREFLHKIEVSANINEAALEIIMKKVGLSRSDIAVRNNTLYLILTEKNAEDLRKIPNIASVTRAENNEGGCFPFSEASAGWTCDNYGPITIPAKNATVNLDTANIALYERIINIHEKNKLEIKDGQIYINDVQSNSYTFKMDYYFMMGDNRDDSADSRFWGFVPEDHVVGKALFIWFSSDKYSGFPKNIRWSRMFKGVK